MAGRVLSLFRAFRGKIKKGPAAVPAQQPAKLQQFQPLQDSERQGRAAGLMSPASSAPSHPSPCGRAPGQHRTGARTAPLATVLRALGIRGRSLPGERSSGCAQSLPDAGKERKQEHDPTRGCFPRPAQVPAAIPTWAGPAVTAGPSTVLGELLATPLSSHPWLCCRSCAFGAERAALQQARPWPSLAPGRPSCRQSLVPAQRPQRAQQSLTVQQLMAGPRLAWPCLRARPSKTPTNQGLARLGEFGASQRLMPGPL